MYTRCVGTQTRACRYNNGDMQILKRQPSFMGARMWSLYARQYLRHFNELDHEFNSRYACREVIR